MEKSQFNLLIEILDRFDKAGILDEVTVIGSWAAVFYEEYFKPGKFSFALKTRDMDFAIQRKQVTGKAVDLGLLLKDIGFRIDFTGKKGYIRLLHPDLIVEFLVPEIGKGTEMPYKLPQFGINAQPLRYLGMLIENTIKVDLKGHKVRVTNPAAYGLHKLIIFKRRAKEEKAVKDLESALNVLDYMVENGGIPEIKRVFGTIHKKWQKTIMDNLKSEGEKKILGILKGEQPETI